MRIHLWLNIATFYSVCIKLRGFVSLRLSCIDLYAYWHRPYIILKSPVHHHIKSSDTWLCNMHLPKIKCIVKIKLHLTKRAVPQYSYNKLHIFQNNAILHAIFNCTIHFILPSSSLDEFIQFAHSSKKNIFKCTPEIHIKIENSAVIIEYRDYKYI